LADRAPLPFKSHRALGKGKARFKRFSFSSGSFLGDDGQRFQGNGSGIFTWPSHGHKIKRTIFVSVNALTQFNLNDMDESFIFHPLLINILKPFFSVWKMEFELGEAL
jgi:hypothetical protein